MNLYQIVEESFDFAFNGSIYYFSGAAIQVFYDTASQVNVYTTGWAHLILSHLQVCFG